LLTADLATGLSTALTKDGQSTPTANIPMGSFKLTGLGAGTAATDAAQYGQLQAGATTIATVTGTDTYVGTLSPAIAAYATGNLFSFVAPNTNTGAATINLNSLGAKNITKQGSTALIAGDIASGRVHIIEYDGTRFQLINPASSTGTGAAVFATSPTLVTPALGTPSSLVLTNATGLPNAGLVNSSITIGGTAIALGGSSNALANDITVYGITVGRGAGAVSTNTAIGNGVFGNSTPTGTNNLAIGYQASYNLTSGVSAVAIGRNAAFTNTTGGDFVAIGRDALYSNTTGSYSVAIGEGALLSNTTASGNTALGYASAYSNTTGADIVAVGFQSGYSNTTGGDNVSVGVNSLYANTTGGSNTAIGKLALRYNTTASNNTAVGYQAMYANTTGTGNIALGHQALQTNTTGVANVALGGSYTGFSPTALSANSTGSYNIAVGSGALASSTTANNNTAVGYQTAYSNSSGNGTYFGYQAGYSSTAYTNTFIGYSSGSAMTSGNQNTILGAYTGNGGGLDIRTSSNYIVLSDGAGNPRVAIDSTNSIGLAGSLNSSVSSGGVLIAAGSGNTTQYIGHITGSASGSAYIAFQYAGSGIGSITQSGTTAVLFNVTSDQRLKENIQDADSASSLIDSLQVRQFDWKTDGNHQRYGFVAQELVTVAPEAVHQPADTEQMMAVDYSKLVPMLVKEIQSLRKRLADAGIA
jgi:hypothetical protein